jgi:glycosyltransferase involved in cell wall biosynthesis
VRSRLADSRFAVVANGFAEGPAQALTQYLVERDARVVQVSHPLTPEQGRRHLVTTFEPGARPRTRQIHTPLRPILSYAIDPLVPVSLPRVDAWFGFNPLACARGLVERKLGRARQTILWSVDFTHDRFGRGNPLTRVYDGFDRLSCTHADAHVELSTAARDARASRLRTGREAAPVHIVPMGMWLERAAKASLDAVRERRIGFMGHLTERQGIAVLLDALQLLRSRGSAVTLEVVGHGDELPKLKAHAAQLGIADDVVFHGYQEDHRDVERLLGGTALGLAPYVPEEGIFTRYADPGKLKSYLGAGLPIVLTDVPPNAHELAERAGAELVAYDPVAIADAIERGLSSEDAWLERHRLALDYAREFDWPVLLGRLLEELGFDTA